MGSRAIELANLKEQTAQEGVDALLSIRGVIDATIIEADNVAYLKVDEDSFDDRKLENIIKAKGDD